MAFRSAACVVLCFGLTACAVGPGAGVTGNDTGGIIPYASMPPEAARDAAVDHCARHGKEARATGVDAQYGGYYSFSCKFDASRAY
jgi:hypothetical protein